MTTVEQTRKRKRRTFTMEDESYARLTMYAQRANTNRSRFLEHLLLMAEPILTWEPPQPAPRHWWKFWTKEPPSAPAPLISMIVDADTPRLSG